MPFQRQLDANRQNAQSSTGPRTPEGRAAVRFNALSHGLTAETAVLANENREQFEETLEAFVAEYQPAGPTENLPTRHGRPGVTPCWWNWRPAAGTSSPSTPSSGRACPAKP